MTAVRKADFAGSWYPGAEAECRLAIDEYLKSSIPWDREGGVGGIVPHAGWYFSGRIALNVIKCLSTDPRPDTVVIFGMHLHPKSGSYIMKEGIWDTPLGGLEIDSDLGKRLEQEFFFHVETPSSHNQDNTIELQLPFVKYLYPDVRILPVGVPPTDDSIRIGEQTAEIAKETGKRLLVLGSTDLTHYGPNYGFISHGVGKKAVEWVKNENDRKIVDLFLSMDAKGVIEESHTSHNACCGGAAAAAIAAAKALGARNGEELIYKTSYDIRPDNSFVGYSGVVFI